MFNFNTIYELLSKEKQKEKKKKKKKKKKDEENHEIIKILN